MKYIVDIHGELEGDYEIIGKYEERLQGDLISRKHLYRRIKTECNPYGKPTIDFESGKRVLDIIDNEPTVEPQKVLIANVTFDMEKLKELTDEIIERIKNGEIVLQDERPKGEWINEFDSLKCPFCGMAIDDEVHWLYSEEFDFNFCPNCGASMKGGAE